MVAVTFGAELVVVEDAAEVERVFAVFSSQPSVMNAGIDWKQNEILNICEKIAYGNKIKFRTVAIKLYLSY